MTVERLSIDKIQFSQSTISQEFTNPDKPYGKDGYAKINVNDKFCHKLYQKVGYITTVQYSNETERTSYDNRRLYWARRREEDGEDREIYCETYEATAIWIPSQNLPQVNSSPRIKYTSERNHVLSWVTVSEDRKTLHLATVKAKTWEALVALRCSCQGKDFPMRGRLDKPTVIDDGLPDGRQTYRRNLKSKLRTNLEKDEEVQRFQGNLEAYLERNSAIYSGYAGGNTFYKNHNWSSLLPQGSLTGFSYHFDCLDYRTCRTDYFIANPRAKKV